MRSTRSGESDQSYLVFRKWKDLYLIITQKLTFMKSGGFHHEIHEIWRISGEIRQISGEIHPKPYKSRCFSKNSSVWGGGCMEGTMTPDFMKSKVIAPLLHSSCISCEIERPLARNCNPMFF